MVSPADTAPGNAPHLTPASASRPELPARDRQRRL